jgi:NAD-dependent SIR2 family protein deacetylase
LGHCHGRVCEIVCLSCGEKRVVNLQDARQVRFCKECKKVADREKSKVARTTKKLSGKSVETLEAQIAEAQKALEALRAAA